SRPSSIEHMAVRTELNRRSRSAGRHPVLESLGRRGLDEVVRLSIVIPAYAEAPYIGATLAEVHGFLEQRGWLATTELVVVTADAADETPAITREALRPFP